MSRTDTVCTALAVLHYSHVVIVVSLLDYTVTVVLICSHSSMIIILEHNMIIIAGLSVYTCFWKPGESLVYGEITHLSTSYLALGM